MPAADRVIEIALERASLHAASERLVISREGHADVAVPFAEIASVVLSHPSVVITRGALDGLARAGASLIVCGDDRLPSGLLLGTNVHFEQTRRIRLQIDLPTPRRKQLWKSIVQHKVRAQASVLTQIVGSDAGLLRLAASVRSGDPTNIEGQAAAVYWPLLFRDSGFLRRTDRSDQNRLLNYGYAVLRASVARAIAGAGLHPSIALHHRGRNDPWCLADDLMEPYRPLIDEHVAEIVRSFGPDAPLDPPTKARLVGILAEPLSHEGESRTVADWISRTVASLVHAMEGREKRVFYPRALTDAPLA
jgi:CRISPR-associated protein Cas1